MSKYTQNGNIYGVKTCCVEVIPLNKTLEEFQDELGEDADDPVSEALEEYKNIEEKFVLTKDNVLIIRRVLSFK